MRILLTVVLAVLCLAAPSAGEDAATVADATERGRSLERILDICLLPEGGAVEGARSLALLLDPTASLQGADLPAALAKALDRHADRLGATHIGVAQVGGRGKTAFRDHREVRATVTATQSIVDEPVAAFQNVYADLRRVAAELKRRPGARDLVLVTLENGDVEQNLEGTVKTLSSAGVRVFVVARQAFLSDTYHVGRTTNVPSGMDAAGPESAFVELPWGWLFQQGRPNESVGSGFAAFGLSRVASATQGRLFLYYPSASTEHRCVTYGSCPFCTGTDHILEDETYRSHRLKVLAPLAGSRKQVYAAAGRDPLYRAVLKAWDEGAKEGLLYGRPSVKLSGGTLAPQRYRPGRTSPLGQSTSFSSLAQRAERLVPDCERILARLEKALASAPDASERYRAVAETTRVMLHVTRVNLIFFAAFCREVGPVWIGRKADDVELPEIPFYVGTERFIGVGWSSLGLCHGARPFLELALPGGETVRAEIEALDAVVAPFFARYAHTPYAAVVRKSGLARFTLTVRGKYVPPPKRRIPGQASDDTTTTPTRPARGGPSGGGSAGPTTGG